MPEDLRFFEVAMGSRDLITENSSPSVICRVAFGDSDEDAAAGVADLIIGDELGLDSGAVVA